MKKARNETTKNKDVILNVKRESDDVILNVNRESDDVISNVKRESDDIISNVKRESDFDGYAWILKALEEVSNKKGNVEEPQRERFEESEEEEGYFEELEEEEGYFEESEEEGEEESSFPPIQSVIKHSRKPKYNNDLTLVESLRKALNKKIRGFRYGRVLNVKDGIASVNGLRQVKSGEVVNFIDGKTKAIINVQGLVLNLNFQNVNIILMGNERLVKAGDIVIHKNNLLKLATTIGLFGNVSTPFGLRQSEDGHGMLSKQYAERFDVVEKKAVGIIGRTPVTTPLRTGIKAVDSLVPIGCGQRELIIGDRQTGKTSVAVDAILSFVRPNNLLLPVVNQTGRHNFSNCLKLRLDHLREVFWFVYVAIGQKQATVANIKYQLDKGGASWFTAVTAAFAADPAPVQFIAPYSGCALGEFMRDIVGASCTMIYDDLSKHAIAYRQMSLLLRRPPGREAFPGDVFYVHSRLLERSGSLITRDVSLKTIDNTDIWYKLEKGNVESEAGKFQTEKTLHPYCIDLMGLGTKEEKE